MRFPSILAVFALSGCSLGLLRGPHTVPKGELRTSWSLEVASGPTPPAPPDDATPFWYLASYAWTYGVEEDADVHLRLSPLGVSGGLRWEPLRGRFGGLAFAPTARIGVVPIRPVLTAAMVEAPVIVGLDFPGDESLILSAGPAVRDDFPGLRRYWTLGAGIEVRGKARTMRPEIRVFLDPLQRERSLVSLGVASEEL